MCINIISELTFSGESHTCAVSLLHGERETVVAAALEASDGVPARSVSTQTSEDLTFIHIYRDRR